MLRSEPEDLRTGDLQADRSRFRCYMEFNNYSVLSSLYYDSGYELVLLFLQTEHSFHILGITKWRGLIGSHEI
jgi:hypothetical protein